jgi:phage shock protein PspC (stress-responsive transcriptional regulator)
MVVDHAGRVIRIGPWSGVDFVRVRPGCGQGPPLIRAAPRPGTLGCMNDTTEQSSPAAAPSAPSTPPPNPPRPPLVRSRSDRKVAGVAGGIAAYLGIDPLILRIVVVVLTLFGGSGLLLYAAGWLLIPDEGEQHSEIERLVGRDREHGPSVGAIIVTVVGLIVLVTSLGVGAAFGHGWWFGGPDLWPVIVVGAIVALVWYARRDQSAQLVAAAPTPPPYPPTSGTPATDASAPASQATTLVDPAVLPAAVTVPAAGGGSDVPPSDPWTPGPTPPAPTPAKKTKQRSVLGALTWWVLLVAAGVMWLLERTGAADISATTFAAVLLGITGLGLVVGAFVGRSRGLVALGILLSLTTALLAATPSVGNGRTGTVVWTPTTVSSVPSDGYELAAGKSTLDLSSTSLDSAAEVHVQQGAGRMVVIVPSTARVVLDASVGIGSIRGPDERHDDGFGPTLNGVYGSPDGPTLDLRLELGVGSMEVRYA